MNINRKFNAGVFTLWIHHKIYVRRNLILYNAWAGQLSQFRLSMFTPVYGCLCCLGNLKTHMGLQSWDWVYQTYPEDPKRSKEFVLVTSWVYPWLFSFLERASGTHSIPVPGLTRQVHAETTVCNLHSCPGPVPAMITHAQILYSNASLPVSLILIGMTLVFPLPSSTMKFGKALLSLPVARIQHRVPWRSLEAVALSLPAVTGASGAASRHSF